MTDEAPSIDRLSRPAARSIIQSLTDGVVPRHGVQLFTAGRERWLRSLDDDLTDLGDDDYAEGRLRIFNGRNGDGKTHLMHLLRDRAFNAGFAVSYVVISDQTPLYRWDRVYAEIGRSVATRSRPDVPGLRAILSPQSPDPDIANDFVSKANSIRSVGQIHPDFATVVYRYCTQQTINVDSAQDMLLLGAWLEGYSHRLQGMAVSSKIDPTNGATMLRSLVLTLRHFGLRGLAILVDEVESVLNLSAPRRRDSYQTLRLLVDRETIPAHTLVVASTTPPMFTDTNRGIMTYPALWSRIKPPTPQTEFINYNATLLDLTLTPLSHGSYTAIGRCIRAIHKHAYDWDSEARVTDAYLETAGKVAAAGRLTLTYSPTRVFVKLVAETLERTHQHPSFHPSIDSLEDEFGEVDLRLKEAEPTPDSSDEI